MENSKPIYGIIQKLRTTRSSMLRTAQSSTLDDVIRDVAGSSVNEESFLHWKGIANYNLSIIIADACLCIVKQVLFMAI